jgi:hypothetical protein
LKKILLGLISAVLAAGCGSKCVPGPFDAPPHCAPLPDAGSPDCQADQACVPILGTGTLNDNRCFAPCNGGRCSQAGFVCQPYGIGDNCENPKTGGLPGSDSGDGGVVQIDCHTAFLCVPQFCN